MEVCKTNLKAQVEAKEGATNGEHSIIGKRLTIRSDLAVSALRSVPDEDENN